MLMLHRPQSGNKHNTPQSKPSTNQQRVWFRNIASVGVEVGMTKWCVYLTVYSGNKLPPFYVGYTAVHKVYNGYHGSVVSQQYQAIWEQEMAEHAELFRTIIVTRHSSKAEARMRETRFLRQLKVKTNPLFINFGNAVACKRKSPPPQIGEIGEPRWLQQPIKNIAMSRASTRLQEEDPAWLQEPLPLINLQETRIQCMANKHEMTVPQFLTHLVDFAWRNGPLPLNGE
jgi:hypothetical protein